MINKAHLTAIGRTKISTPMRWLNSRGLIQGWDILDYGCGRGFDADQFQMEKYDPHYFPNDALLERKWDLIVCHYVLNVVSEPVAQHIMDKIESMLNAGGQAFITVRCDVKVEGFTSKGTYQRNPVLSLPVVHKTSSFCIYQLDKHSTL